MSHPKYPLMFSPLTIRGNRLKNRIIMGSMHSGWKTCPMRRSGFRPTSSSA